MNTGKLAGAENVAAIADALPGFNVAPRLMLLAPAGTPAAIVERLNEAVRGVLESADLAQAAAQQGAILAYLPPSQLAATLAQELAGRMGRPHEDTEDRVGVSEATRAAAARRSRPMSRSDVNRKVPWCRSTPAYHGSTRCRR